MPALDLRQTAVAARQDLAFAMHSRRLPIELITAECRYTDKASTYRAIKAGRERSERNEGRISQRMFGVEVEFNRCSRLDVVNAIYSASPGFEIEIEGYNHSVREHWKLITDSSVNAVGGESSGDSDCDCGDDECGGGSNYGEGLEAVSPILQGKEGFDSLRTVVTGIRAAGGDIDRSCGLHVHHDARDMTPDALAHMLEFYIVNQLVIDLMLAPSRRSSYGNQWCKGYSNIEKMSVVQQAKANKRFGMWDRYKTVNITAYPKYGSIEFRQHQGTLNLQKIENWVRFGQSLMEAAIKDEGEEVIPFSELEPMLDYLVKNGGLPKTSMDYLLQRAASYVS